LPRLSYQRDDRRYPEHEKKYSHNLHICTASLSSALTPKIDYHSVLEIKVNYIG